jgi:hypothetical protein
VRYLIFSSFKIVQWLLLRFAALLGSGRRPRRRRTTEAAKFPVDAVEFAPDGTITVRTRVAMSSVAKPEPEPNDFDNGDHQAEARQ